MIEFELDGEKFTIKNDKVKGPNNTTRATLRKLYSDMPSPSPADGEKDFVFFEQYIKKFPSAKMLKYTYTGTKKKLIF